MAMPAGAVACHSQFPFVCGSATQVEVYGPGLALDYGDDNDDDDNYLTKG